MQTPPSHPPDTYTHSHTRTNTHVECNSEHAREICSHVRAVVRARARARKSLHEHTLAVHSFDKIASGSHHCNTLTYTDSGTRRHTDTPSRVLSVSLATCSVSWPL